MRSLKIQPDPKKKEIKAKQTHKTKTKHIKKKKKTFTNNIDFSMHSRSLCTKFKKHKTRKKMDLITNLEEKSG
jgi:hypothetical protein